MTFPLSIRLLQHQSEGIPDVDGNPLNSSVCSMSFELSKTSNAPQDDSPNIPSLASPLFEETVDKTEIPFTTN